MYTLEKLHKLHASRINANTDAWSEVILKMPKLRDKEEILEAVGLG